MGQVPEVLPGVGQQLALTQRGVVDDLRGTDPLQQVGPVLGDMAEEGVDQACLTMTMTQHQHPISRLQQRGEPRQVVMVERGSLARKVAIVAMGEVLVGGPGPMGPQGCLLHGLTLEAVDIGPAMVEADHQPARLIAPLGRRAHSCGIELGMEAGVQQQAAYPQHIVGGENGVMMTRGMVQPGFTAIG